MIEKLRHCASRVINGGVSEDQKGARARALHQAELGLKRGNAGTLCSNERARHVKSVFRQELVEVVTGYAAGDFGKAGADEIGVLVANGLQL